MLSLIAIVVYVGFAGLTALLVWAAGEFARRADADGQREPGGNPHAGRV